MMAKEKLITSLYDIRHKNLLSLSNPEEPAGTTSNILYNLDTGALVNESALGRHIEEENSLLRLNEPELMSMYFKNEKILHKCPGNFDIVSTHHDVRIGHMSK